MFNGNHHGAQVAAAQQAMQDGMRQFQHFVQTALDRALTMLAPGYQASVLFTFKGKPERDIVVAQASYEDILTALLAKASPVQIAMVKNFGTGPKQAEGAPTDAQRLDAIRSAMRFLPRSLATEMFRQKITAALGGDEKDIAAASAPANDAAAPAEVLVCPCGSTKTFKAFGTGHIMCLECDHDFTEAQR